LAIEGNCELGSTQIDGQLFIVKRPRDFKNKSCNNIIIKIFCGATNKIVTMSNINNNGNNPIILQNLIRREHGTSNSLSNNFQLKLFASECH
jgi:hypothetical protein